MFIDRLTAKIAKYRLSFIEKNFMNTVVQAEYARYGLLQLKGLFGTTLSVEEH